MYLGLGGKVLSHTHSLYDYDSLTYSTILTLTLSSHTTNTHNTHNTHT
jgi:hypothetical protein